MGFMGVFSTCMWFYHEKVRFFFLSNFNLFFSLSLPITLTPKISGKGWNNWLSPPVIQ